MTDRPRPAGRTKETAHAPAQWLAVVLTAVVVGAGVVAVAWFQQATQGMVVVNGVGFGTAPPLCARAGFWTDSPSQFRVAPSTVFNLSWQFECVAPGPNNGSPLLPAYVARSVSSTSPGFAVLSSTLPRSFGYQERGSVTVEVLAPGAPGFYLLEFELGGTTVA
jgi:hypothetical protein